VSARVQRAADGERSGIPSTSGATVGIVANGCSLWLSDAANGYRSVAGTFLQSPPGLRRPAGERPRVGGTRGRCA
jgi:hypothetical protein